MRVLVCGSRHFNDDEHLFEILDLINGTFDLEKKISCIISGKAKGADTLAETYAEVQKIPFEGYPADWNTHGKAAGPIRNSQMLKEGKPDLVVAFLAPDSRGTKNMIEQASKAGVPVQVVNIK
jgi:hypothetical protein